MNRGGDPLARVAAPFLQHSTTNTHPARHDVARTPEEPP
jgi:hypothetical protein